MNPYLRASLICFAIAGIALWLLLSGCSTYTALGVCRHEATYAISVVGEKHPVRVAVGPWGIRERLIMHSQAQMWLDGQWQWLCVDYPAVSTCAKDPEFVPEQYYIPRIWLGNIIGGNLRANN